MAATATDPTDGTIKEIGLPGIDMVAFTITTGANGEDGVSYDTGFREVIGVHATGLAAAKYGPFSAVIDGSTVEIYSEAGASGDAALVSVIAWGYRG